MHHSSCRSAGSPPVTALRTMAVRSCCRGECFHVDRRAAESSGAPVAIHGPIPQADLLADRLLTASQQLLTSYCSPITHCAAGCRRAAESSGAPVSVHGPIPQADLLAALGIGVRLESLLQSCTGDGAADALTSGYARQADSKSRVHCSSG